MVLFERGRVHNERVMGKEQLKTYIAESCTIYHR
jgi:hypothetical protein